jgi:hypothetical protein
MFPTAGDMQIQTIGSQPFRFLRGGKLVRNPVVNLSPLGEPNDARALPLRAVRKKGLSLRSCQNRLQPLYTLLKPLGVEVLRAARLSDACELLSISRDQAHRIMEQAVARVLGAPFVGRAQRGGHR